MRCRLSTLFGAFAVLLFVAVAAMAGDVNPNIVIPRGQIQLKGVILDPDPVTKHFAMQVQEVKEPQGASRPLLPPRDKMVESAAAAAVTVNDAGSLVPSAVLHHGDTILAIGPNSGNGRPFTARLIIVIGHMAAPADTSPPPVPATPPAAEPTSGVSEPVLGASAAPPAAASTPAAALVPALDFTVGDLGGQPVKLSDFRGKVVVLEFWSTNSFACQESIPFTSAIASKYSKNGVVVFAVNVWDMQRSFEGWMRAHNMYMSIQFAIDPTRPPGDVATALYNVKQLPTVFVIDRAGNIVHSIAGFMRPSQELSKAIESALAAPAPLTPAQ